jgi:hypothetical protein
MNLDNYFTVSLFIKIVSSSTKVFPKSSTRVKFRLFLPYFLLYDGYMQWNLFIQTAFNK